MNLRELEIFVAVVEAGGFTSAAGRLSIAQPAVTVSVQRLERRLGVQLLIRERRRIALTAEGTAFLGHAKAILTQVTTSQREMAAWRALETGHVSIGAPPMVAAHLLPAVLDGFLEQSPGIRLTVAQAGSEEVAARVLRSELDLGVIADWHTPDGLTTQILEHHPIVAVVSTTSRLAERSRLDWADLVHERLILFPRGYHQRSRIEEAAARLQRPLQLIVEAESEPLMLDLVRQGHGVATLLSAAAAGVPGIHVLTLPADALVPVAVCRRVQPPRGRAVDAFHEFLVQHFTSSNHSAGRSQTNRRDTPRTSRR